MDRELESIVQWWASQGVDVPDLPAPRPAKPSPELNVAEASAAQATANVAPKPGIKPKSKAPKTSGDPATLAASATTLAELKSVLDTFDAGALTAGARQAVFSRGNAQARVMIIGEAPGRDEDLHGKPFIGRSGQLLDLMMGAIGLNEDAFYVTNVVNWRPEKNRTPTKAEIELCRPFLFRHIALQEPDILVLTGNVPLQALTGETGIMRQRGHWRDADVEGVSYPCLPIYHPAFLLRQPALKKDAWRDLLSLRQKLDEAG